MYTHHKPDQSIESKQFIKGKYKKKNLNLKFSEYYFLFSYFTSLLAEKVKL
jgi:hypothetical protein